MLGLCLALLIARGGPSASGAAPPFITQQPQKRTAVEGTSHSFNVTATGDEPLSYQWFFNGAALVDRTNSTLPLTNIQMTNAGGYQVTITNLAGAVTSAIATLTVRSTNDPVYAPPDRGWAYLYTGDGVSSTGQAALDGTWNHDNGSSAWAGDGRGASSPPPGGVSTTNGVLTLEDDVVTPTVTKDNRRFYFTHNLVQEPAVTNAGTLLNDGVTLSFRARLTRPTDSLLELTNAPNGFINTGDGKGLFGLRTRAASSMIISFSLNQVQEDTNTTGNFSFSQAGLHMNSLVANLPSPFVDPGEGGTTNLLPLDPALFHEFWITLQDNGPDPGTHRVSIYLDGSLTPTVFNVTAGTGSDSSTSDTNLTNYLALGLPSTPQRGAVDLDFFGYKPGVILPAGFNDPLGFAFQPADQTVAAGRMATFTCGVTGTPPYFFQWYQNGAPISDATNASHTTAPMTAADEGTLFTVVVTNDCGAITSSPPAVLRLLTPPVITTQPVNLVGTNGAPATFSVAASNGVPPTYQWRFNGGDLPEATNSNYTIPNVTPSHAGAYDVVVRNDAGSVTSLVATLTVRTLDFGDAPPPYPTLLGDNGARHVLLDGLRLGAGVDFELNGQPNPAATGDDAIDSDDEDGVRFTTALLVGQPATVEVVASTAGLLDAWIDFNANGTWADPGEQIFTSRPLAAGTNALNFVVAGSARPTNTFARFRFSSAGGLTFTGPAANGEVEDYALDLQPAADLAVIATAAPNPVAVLSNLTYTVSVNNTGPSPATVAILTNILPTGATFLSATPSQGSCSPAGGIVTCTLGGLAAGAAASVTLVVAPTATGVAALQATVRADEADVNLSNNSTLATVTVLDPPRITAPPQSLTLTQGQTASFTVTASGTPPLAYQWRLNDNDLAGQTNATLTLSNVQAASAGAYSVRISNLVGAVQSAPATLTVLVPPQIMQPPQSRTNIAGTTATFTVVVVGTEPFAYQWFYNDADPVPGGTNATLTLPNVETFQAGPYHVRVSNLAGVTESSPATLTVFEYDFGDAPDPSYPTLLAHNGARHRINPFVRLGSRIDFEPEGQPNFSASGDDASPSDDEEGVAFFGPLLVGQTVRLAVSPSADGFLNAWVDYDRNGSWADPGEQVFTNQSVTAGVRMLEVAVPAAANPGVSYARFRFSTAANLTFEGEAPDGEVEDFVVVLGTAVDLAVAPRVEPDPLPTGTNFTMTLSITNRGPSTATAVSLTNQLAGGVIFLEATASSGQCSHEAGVVGCQLGNLAPSNSATVTIVAMPALPGNFTNTATVSADDFEIAPVDNSAQSVTRALDLPVIVVPPQSQTVTNEDTISMSVLAAGTDLQFQWRHNGMDLPDGTNAVLTLSNVQPANAGAYVAQASNAVGRVTSQPATLSVLVRVVITTSPQSLTVTQGHTAIFTVAAAGSPTLQYQWRREGVDLPDATGDTLVLNNVQPTQAGNYTVRVSNFVSSKISDPATLTVLLPPQILTPPQDRTSFAGSDAVLTVVADGTALHYQWYFQGTNRLNGATNAALVLTNVQTSDTGNYSVAVSNILGVATSAVARLTVVEVDFGDAPEPYPTLLPAGGAYHLIVPGLHLGASSPDFEPDGQPNANATGDDSAQSNDDDGVTFAAPLLVGQTAAVTVLASTNGFLDAWIDFDANRNWFDLSDHIFAGQVVTAGLNTLTFTVPSTAQTTNTFARFRFSSMGGLMADGPAPDGEVEDYAVEIRPAADLAVAGVDWPRAIPSGGPMTYAIVVTNLGPSAATAVTLNDVLPGFAFVSASASQGTCTQANGTVTCALGSLNAGAQATVTIGVLAGPTGEYTNVVRVQALESDPGPGNNLSKLATAVYASTPTFSNTNSIGLTLPGAALLYPSAVLVSGLTAAVYKVTVTLHQVSHEFPDDLDILLVGPGGQTTLLMSDVGGDHPIDQVTITLDDEAPIRLPDSGDIFSRTYRPSDYANEPDEFPAPAPAGPYGSSLAAFRGTNPNGTWSLFVADDSVLDVGAIVGGWSISFGTVNPMADLAVTAFGGPSASEPGANLTYTIMLTNRGPVDATDVVLTDPLPTNLTFLSAVASQGSCTNEAGTVRCQLGTLTNGAVAAATIVAAPNASGTATNTVSVASREVDLNPADNSASVLTHVTLPIDLAVSQRASPEPVLVGENLTYTLVVTNHEANAASNVMLMDLLPPDTAFVSATPSLACSNDEGLVTCQLGLLPGQSSVSVELVVTPQRPVLLTNLAVVTAFELDVDLANNSTDRVTPAILVPPPFLSAGALTISGSATAPYPSVILVSGLTASVHKVTVTLSNLTHPFPDDLDILLVGPSGQTVMLMSDAGGANGVTDLTLSFDDEASSALPDFTPLTAGTFRPTNHDPGSDNFPAPAPAGSAATALAAFEGTDPNGPWSLFVLDDGAPNDGSPREIGQGLVAGADEGIISRGELAGWSLALEAIHPMADLAVARRDAPDPIAATSNLTSIITVTNRGPAGATDVRLIQTATDGFIAVAVPSQGSCTNDGGIVRCALGTLGSGGFATVTVIGASSSPGPLGLNAAVSSRDLDLNAADNSASATITVEAPPVILSQPQSRTITNGQSVTFTVTATGAPPMAYQWQKDGSDVLGATNDALAFALATPLERGVYTVRVANRVGDVLSHPATLRVLVPPTLVLPPNTETLEDTSTAPLPVRVGDDETPAEQLILTAFSSNPEIIPAGNIGLGGFSSNRTLTVAPAPNLSGSASVTVTVTDADGLSTTGSFELRVLPVNDPPVIGNIPPQFVSEDTPLTVAFTVSDPETNAASLLVAGSAANAVLVPEAGLVLGGADVQRTLTILPATNQFGSTVISIAATDPEGASSTNSFVLTVVPVNDPPTISALADQTIAEDSSLGPIAVTVGDLESPAANLVLEGLSSNAALVPDGQIALGGSGSNRTVTITPGAHRSGTATLTLRVRDPDGMAASTSFLLTVTPSNDPPTLASVPDVTMSPNTSLGLPVAIGDLESDPGSLVLSASSSNPTLIPNENCVVGGTGANRTLALTPLANQLGTATITLTVSDGLASGTETFVLTVRLPQDPPVIVLPPQSQTVSRGASVTFGVTAAGAAPLGYQWRWGSANLGGATHATLQLNNVQPSNAGPYTVVVTNLFGSITSAVATLTVTGNPGSGQPSLSSIPNQTTPEDVPIEVPFTIQDADTLPMFLTVTALSTNTSLVPNANLVVSGSGTNRTLAVVPAANLFGTTRITLTVSDGVALASNAFVLTVTSVNDPPTLNPPPNVYKDAGFANFNYPISGITAGASNENQTLTVTAVSSNTALVTVNSVNYSSGTTGTLALRRVNNSATGAAVIAVTVTDNGGAAITRTFTVFVKASANSPPTLSAIANQTIQEDATAGPIAFTVGDAATGAAQLTLSGSSSNQVLVPNGNIVFGGSGSNRTVTVTPVLHQSGSSIITIAVADAAFGVTSTNFVLTVNPVNDPPTIGDIPNQSVNENGVLGPVAFTVGDVDTVARDLTVAATSSDQALVPNVNIALGGSGTERAFLITPAPNRSGSATITVTVSDGSQSTNDTFVLTVLPGNQPPNVSEIPNQIIPANTPTAPVAFTVGDRETSAGALTVAAASSNPTLVPDANIVLGGSGSNRTVRVTPAAGQSGVANITVRVTDAAGAMARAAFVLTVIPPNEPPTLDPIADVLLPESAGLRNITLTGIRAGVSSSENQVLAVTASSSHLGLLPHPTIDYTSPNALGTLTLAPTPGSNGVATVVVTVNDGQNQSNLFSRSFIVTVNAAPTLSPLADRQTLEDGPVLVPFSIADLETPASDLGVAVASSNTNLVSETGLLVSGAGADRTLTVTPRPNESGQATLTVVVGDGSANWRSNRFVLIVTPVNDAPTLAPISQLALAENAGARTIDLAGISAGPPNEIQTVSLSAVSDNPAVVPHPTVSYLNGSSTGTLTLTPTTNATGLATMIVTVQDSGDTLHGGTNQFSRQFVVTVGGAPIPVLAIGRVGEVIALAFDTVNAVHYVIEYTGSLSAPEWLTLTTVTGTGGRVTVPDATVTGSQRFYRLRLP
jgi:uncharacterized repeat protein (TIGR01451 family)